MFRETCSRIEQDPEEAPLDLLGAEDLPPWKDLPILGKFKVAYPFVDKKQRRATPEDKLKQQRSYYRYLQWLASCNLTEEEFLDNLRKASQKTVRRWDGIPKLLQNRHSLRKRSHALLLCRALAYQRAASVVGHSVGGETMAQEARAYLTELLSSTKEDCLENVNLVPKELIPNELLQNPSTHAVAAIPVLVHWWLRQKLPLEIINQAASMFRETCSRIEQDPEEAPLELSGAEDLPLWKDLPLLGNFKVAVPYVNHVRRRATPADKLEQQRSYHRYLQWLASCNLTEEDFLDNLRKASQRTLQKHDVGITGIPKLLQNRIYNKRKHAVLACRALAYQRAASVAGHSVGGVTMAQEARAYVTKLLSSTNPDCLENLNLVPKELITNDLLQSPSTRAVAALPVLVHWWLRQRVVAPCQGRE